MTLQYDQSNINLRDATPVVATTLEAATPVVITLGEITDGQNLVINMTGGGSAPGDAVANNYVIRDFHVLFTRESGVGFANLINQIQSFGGAVSLVGGVDDATTPGTTICNLTITGPDFTYNHNLRYSRTLF